MSVPYVFTQDDEMNPVYCVKCRSHIPRAVSNLNAGLCRSCSSQTVVQQAPIDTGMGHCPQCQSRHIAEIKNTVDGNYNGWFLAGALLTIGAILVPCFLPGLIVTVPIMLIGLFNPAKKVVGLSRQCVTCGCRWQV